MSPDSLLDPVRHLVTDMGFELVEFRRSGPPQRPVIQVRIDRADSRPGFGITADDCALVSRALERYFEGPGGVGSRYQLQVSSPGIERPVRFPEHWQRYAGRVVKLTARGVAGHPHAVILGVPDAGHVRVRLPDGAETVIALEQVKEALLLEAADPSAPGRREP